MDVASDPWQPIETAPLTSQARLVWCAERKNTYVASWMAEYETREPGWHHFAVGMPKMDETPTHWMPLPDPPKASESVS